MIRFQSRRLSLRDFTKDDTDFVMQLYNDPDCLRFIGDRGIHDEASAIAYIGAIQAAGIEHGYGLYVACLEDGTAAGVCGLVQREYLDFADIGFAFLPDYRNGGYALEAAEATIDYARQLQLPELGAIVMPENKRSLALLEKLGFQYHSPITLPNGDSIALYKQLLD